MTGDSLIIRIPKDCVIDSNDKALLINLGPIEDVLRLVIAAKTHPGKVASFENDKG